MQKLYFYITVLLLFAHISCSSPAHYKTAKITEKELETTLGMSVFSHERYSNSEIEGYRSGDTSSGTTAQFQVSNWVRLSKNNDLGITLVGVLGGLQTVVRQHIRQQNGLLPEVSVGASYGSYIFSYGNFTQEEKGIPLYLSWSLDDEKEYFLIYEPKQLLFYEAEGGFIRSHGYQFVNGIRIERFFLEHSYSFIDPRFNQHNFSIGFRLSN